MPITITVRNDGTVAFSPDAVMKFSLSEGDKMAFLYQEPTETLAMVQVPEWMDGISLEREPDGHLIATAALDFLALFGRPSQQRTYRARFDASRKTILVSMKHRKQNVTKERSK